MKAPLESPDGRAVGPVLGVVLLVGLAVVCSAALGTVLIDVDGDREPTPRASVAVETVVVDDTDGFVALAVESLTDAEYVTVTATTTDGTAAIADGTATGTAELTERRDAGDSIAIRERVDDPRDVELRLVVRAHRGGASAVAFDRTVIV